jgi:uncharacterized damage-inducible protein DinB
MTATSPGPVVPERYLAALGENDPLKSMRKAPKRVARLVEQLSAKKAKRRVEPGKWSIHEVVAHLADGEVVLGARLRMVAAEDGKRVVAYDQDAFVTGLGVDGVPTRELLEDFAAVRRANVRLLERLPKEAFAKAGIHDERGKESVEDMLRMYAGHDLVHEAQIERLIAVLDAEKRAAKAEKRAARAAEPAKPPKAEKAPEPGEAKRTETDGAGRRGKRSKKRAKRGKAARDEALPMVEGARISAVR